MTADAPDVGQPRPGLASSANSTGHQDLGADHQLGADGQLVEGGGDSAFDRALDRHDAQLRLAAADSVKRGLNRCAGQGVGLPAPSSARTAASVNVPRGPR